MLTMFNEGYADPNQNYDASQGAFLTGDVAMLMNGTWAVDQYNREAPFTYMAMDFPTLYATPSTWANSHTWAVPVQESDAKYDAAVTFLAFLNDHVEDWAKGTGHLASAPRSWKSHSYAQAPQRANYANTANIAKLVPAILNWGRPSRISSRKSWSPHGWPGWSRPRPCRMPTTASTIHWLIRL